MGIFSSLFQASKAHLSPAARGLVASLEIMIVGVVIAALQVGTDYLNGHPGDLAGVMPLVWSTLLIALGKGFASLSPQVQQLFTTLQPPPPPVVIHNNMPLPASAPVQPAPAPAPTPTPMPVPQVPFPAPAPTFEAPAPTATPLPLSRDFTGMVPSVQPPPPPVQ